jgi:hypothetical protein
MIHHSDSVTQNNNNNNNKKSFSLEPSFSSSVPHSERMDPMVSDSRQNLSTSTKKQKLEVEMENEEQQIQREEEQMKLMSFSEQELLNIDKSFSMGNMNAYGNIQKEQQILNLVDRVSSLQLKSFLNSMEIELNYSTAEEKHSNLSESDDTARKSQNKNDYDDFEDESAFGNISKNFKEKERAIITLLKDLDQIQDGIEQISNLIHSPNNHLKENVTSASNKSTPR